jgi:hypothetical protein
MHGCAGQPRHGRTGWRLPHRRRRAVIDAVEMVSPVHTGAGFPGAPGGRFRAGCRLNPAARIGGAVPGRSPFRYLRSSPAMGQPFPHSRSFTQGAACPPGPIMLTLVNRPGGRPHACPGASGPQLRHGQASLAAGEVLPGTGDGTFALSGSMIRDAGPLRATTPDTAVHIVRSAVTGPHAPLVACLFPTHHRPRPRPGYRNQYSGKLRCRTANGTAAVGVCVS